MIDPKNTYVILLNGPIGSGKDHIADLLEKYVGWNKCMFKDELYKETAAHFNVDLEWFKAVSSDRLLKEKPSDALDGKSPRQALIHVSEDVIKPEKGKGYFGELSSDQLKETVNVFSDSGFKEEAIALIEKSGIQKTNVFHIKLIREGCEFSSNDSRGYFDLDGVNTATFYNNIDDNGIVQQFLMVIRKMWGVV